MILYKYCSEDRLDVIIDRTVRFTQPIFFNDPFELLATQKTAELTDAIETQMYLAREETISKDYTELRAAGYAVPSEEEFRQSRLQKFYEKISGAGLDPYYPIHFARGNTFQRMASIFTGVLCLTETSDNYLMWCHYSSKCAGFVIGFDSQHEWFRESRVNEIVGCLRKVAYSDERVDLDSRVKGDEFESFFQKGRHWEYEQEWRMVYPLKNCIMNNEQVFVREFPADCVVSLIMGCRMKQPDRVSFLKAARSFPNARLLRSFPNSRSYGMDIVPYESGLQFVFSETWGELG